MYWQNKKASLWHFSNALKARMITATVVNTIRPFRRQLVDVGFLHRAIDGEIYRLSPERIAEVLTPTA